MGLFFLELCTGIWMKVHPNKNHHNRGQTIVGILVDSPILDNSLIFFNNVAVLETSLNSTNFSYFVASTPLKFYQLFLFHNCNSAKILPIFPISQLQLR